MTLSEFVGVGAVLSWGTVPLIFAAGEGLIINFWRAAVVTLLVGVAAYLVLAAHLPFDDAAGLAMWITLSFGCVIGGGFDVIYWYWTHRSRNAQP